MASRISELSLLRCLKYQLNSPNSLLLVLLFLNAHMVTPARAGVMDTFKKYQGVVRGGQPLSETQIVEGLKEALEIGTERAVANVSQTNGYYGNPKIKIPLPKTLKSAEGLLRAAGYGKKVDGFELSMNRAAERAAPEAKAIFWDALRQLRFDDAKRILNGRENEATRYFEEKTRQPLFEIFEPIIQKTMGEVGVARSYQQIEDKLRNLPLAGGAMDLDLDRYVTDRTLDGLFLTLAEEEKRIRQDPAARVTDTLKKVFGQKK
jgi:hypothetical protein